MGNVHRAKMYRNQFISLAFHLRHLSVRIPPRVMDAICNFCYSQNSAFKAMRFRDYVAGRCGPCGGVVVRKRKENKSS